MKESPFIPFIRFGKSNLACCQKHNLKTNKFLNHAISEIKKKTITTHLQLQKPMISVCHVKIPALDEDNVYLLHG
jgi:hypothetical protein